MSSSPAVPCKFVIVMRCQRRARTSNNPTRVLHFVLHVVHCWCLFRLSLIKLKEPHKLHIVFEQFFRYFLSKIKNVSLLLQASYCTIWDIINCSFETNKQCLSLIHPKYSFYLLCILSKRFELSYNPVTLLLETKRRLFIHKAVFLNLFSNVSSLIVQSNTMVEYK